MIEAIKVIVSLVLAIALLCGVVCILMNFPFIILAVALLALLCFFVWGLTNFFLMKNKLKRFFCAPNTWENDYYDRINGWRLLVLCALR